MELDDINIKILTILQKNCRESLVNISKEVNLSVDSVKKRINKLLKNKIFYPKIQIRPRHFGFPNIIEVNIKIHHDSKKEYEEFISYLIKHPRITQVLIISGDWDLKIVFLAKDHGDQSIVSREIRNKFNKIIAEWNECLTNFVKKFENYNLKELK